MKLIGLSLSSCIKDLCLNRNPNGNVIAIISGTAFSKKNWQEEAYEHYGKTIWKNLDKEDVMYYLDHYPIIQPRLFDHHPPSVANGHWIELGIDPNGDLNSVIRFAK